MILILKLSSSMKIIISQKLQEEEFEFNADPEDTAYDDMVGPQVDCR